MAVSRRLPKSRLDARFVNHTETLAIDAPSPLHSDTVERGRTLGRSLARLLVVLLPLSLIPLYFAIRLAVGPYFLSGNADPDYAYLCNSLNLALGHAPRHFDHPGTPVQLLGALVIRFGYSGQDAAQTAVNVLQDGEAVLERLNLVLFGGLFLALLLGSALVHGRSGPWASALCLPAVWLLLGANLPCLVRANPEPALLAICFLLGLAIYLYRDAKTTPWSFVVLSALLCGTGLATKLTFLPFALLPLFVIRGWRARAAFAGLLVLVVALWLMPIWGSLGRLFSWTSALASRQGRYGSGPTGWMNWSSLGSNWAYLFGNNLAFVTLLIASVSAAVWIAVLRRDRSEAEKKAARLLLVVSLFQLCQFAMIGKYHESRYLVPSIGLAPLNLLLLRMLFQHPSARRWVVSGLALLLGVAAWESSASLLRLRAATVNSVAVAGRASTDSKGTTRVLCYGSSSPYYALYFGNGFAGGVYGELLQQMYGQDERVFFYNNFQKCYQTFAARVTLDQILSQPGPVVYQSPPFGTGDRIYAWPEGVKLREIFGGPAEKIYQVEKQASAGL